ncbi:MAG: hypothetical protein ACREPI_10105, partial [Candidatus Dormibacterales bacterium]
MADETPTVTPRRRRTRRATAAGTGTRATGATRRRRLRGPELVENLNQMVDQLIKENRKLRRQVDRLGARGTAASGTTVERGLRSIQRRVQRAIDSGSTTRRRRTTTTTRRRRTTATRRRRAPVVSSASGA